jgi:hypothetical protein
MAIMAGPREIVRAPAAESMLSSGPVAVRLNGHHSIVTKSEGIVFLVSTVYIVQVEA